MKQKILILTLLFLLSFSLIQAETFIPDMTLSKAYTVTNNVDPTGEKLVYAIDADDYSILQFSLAGEGAYKPMLSIWDPAAEKYIVQQLQPDGTNIVELTYIMSTKQYYAIINNAGSSGSYTFTYTPIMQNDADLGMDATKRFRDADIIALGTYTGDLGDEDEKDYYAIDLIRDEEITITVKAKDDGYLKIELIDSSGFTKIDNGERLISGEEFFSVYSSLKDQTAYVGIGGDVSYTMTIESDARDTSMAEVIAGVEDSMDEVAALADDAEAALADLQQTITDAQKEIEQQEKKGTAWIIILIVVILGAGGFAYWKFFMQEQPKKSVKKTTKKKK